MKPSSGREDRPRVIFDTNDLISAWFWDGNEAELIELVESGIIAGYSSEQLLEELFRALRYPKFRLTRSQVESIYSYYLLLLRTVNPKRAVDIIKDDPDDNKVLECALEAQADYIVSGDHHLLNLGEYRGIRVINASELINKAKNLDMHLRFNNAIEIR